MNVCRYFDSIKEEILVSGFVNISEWNQNILLKAQNYHKTDKVKNIKKYPEDKTWRQPKYGLGPILLSHLIGIILYCDWTDLQNDFSGTFRKNNIFETIQSIKARHSKYYHFSKGLVEAVKYFGINGRGWNDDDNGRRIECVWDYEVGTFYCGLSAVLNIPCFAILLNGPCSTSKQKEISIRFATRDGIIMQLTNNNGSAQFTRFFDCSWISCYPEEDERLFIASRQRMKIDTIIVIETANNYEVFFNALYLFDAIISGQDITLSFENDRVNVKLSDIEILRSLINNKLLNKTSHKIDEYISNCFDLFLNTKTQIYIDISHSIDPYNTLKGKVFRRGVDSYFSALGDLLLFGVECDKVLKVSDVLCDDKYEWVQNREKEENDNKIKEKEDKPYHDKQQKNKYPTKTDKKKIKKNNIIKIKILSIFPNLKKLQISTTYTHELTKEYRSYPFSLQSFLSELENAKLSIKCIITAEYEQDWDDDGKYIDTKTWINNIISPSIQKSYNDKQWNIKTKKYSNCDELIIDKY